MYYEDYDIVPENEVRTILAEIPFDLMMESIVEQINDPTNTRSDFLGTILDKVDMYLENHSENADDVSIINEELSEFLLRVISSIDKKFDIGLDEEYLTNIDTIRDVAECLYEFFILNYRDNLSLYIFNYITRYKSALSKMFDDPNKSDVSTAAMKKHLKDKDSINIVSNLPDIMKYIVNTVDMEPMEFFELASEDDDYSPARLAEIFAMGRMIGGFVNNFLKLCLDDKDYIYDEIQTEVRGSILLNFTNLYDDEEEDI